MLSFLNYLRHVSWQTSDSESDTEQFLPLTRFLNVPGPDHFMGKPRLAGEPVTEICSLFSLIAVSPTL